MLRTVRDSIASRAAVARKRKCRSEVELGVLELAHAPLHFGKVLCTVHIALDAALTIALSGLHHPAVDRMDRGRQRRREPFERLRALARDFERLRTDRVVEEAVAFVEWDTAVHTKPRILLAEESAAR